MRFRFIDAERAGLAMPIFRLCRLLQVSVSGFYAWRNRGPSQRQLDDMVLLAHVRAAFRRSRESYGAERVHHELAENGIEVGRHRVARLMRGNGLSPKRKQKFKKTTDSQHNKAVASNLLDQNFSAEAPNEKWAADISYIWTAQGWLYLAVMLDLYSRRVIGWAVGARMTSDLPLRALNRAIGLRQPGAGVIHHSDRGSQGGFNRSSQHVQFDWPASTGPELRREFSIRGSCGDDLEAFVKNRNLIVHDYWRLTKGLIRDGQTLENGVPAGIPWRLPTMGRNPPRRSGRNEAERRPSDW